MLDRRLTPFERPAEVDGGEQPAGDFCPTEPRAMSKGIASCPHRLDPGGRGDCAQASPEIKADVGLRLLSPAERATPCIGLQEQREGEDWDEENRGPCGEASGGAQLVHGAHAI